VAGSAILIGGMCILASVCIYRRNKHYSKRDKSRMASFEEHFSSDASDSSSNHGSYEDPNSLLDHHNHHSAFAMFQEELERVQDVENDGIN